MAEAPGDAPEGWHVPQRAAFLAAVLVPLTLLAVVLAAGWAYGRYLRPQQRQPVTTFPAPGIETYIHDGRGDPPRPVRSPPVDAAVARAKRDIATHGLPDWRQQR